MKTKTYRNEKITQIDEAFITAWKLLWKQAENASIFNAYEWFITCQETELIREYEIYACYKDERLVAVLPLHKERTFGIETLSSIGNTFLVDTAFLIERYDAELFKHFFTPLFTQKNVFLHKVDQQATVLFQKIFPETFLSLISVNPTVPITEDITVSITASTVSQIKKIIRKNPDQFRFELSNGNENAKKHLKMMIDLEQNSAKKLRSMDIFSDEKTKRFFTSITKNSPERVFIGFLYYNDEPIAYQFGFLYRDIFAAYQTAYLYEYSKLRPGKTMLFHLLSDLKEQNVASIDLGGGISSYKQEFTHDYRLLYDVSYSHNRIVMQIWKTINTVRRIKQQLFPIKHTRDHEFLFKEFETH
jgi:hypothetical protein